MPTPSPDISLSPSEIKPVLRSAIGRSAGLPYSWVASAARIFSSSGESGVDWTDGAAAACAVVAPAAMPPNAAAAATAAANVQRSLCLVRLIAPPRLLVTTGIYWPVGRVGNR